MGILDKKVPARGQRDNPGSCGIDFFSHPESFQQGCFLVIKLDLALEVGPFLLDKFFGLEPGDLWCRGPVSEAREPGPRSQ